MRKITLFLMSLFLTVGAMAQTFSEPQVGRLYKIKGDSGSHPWVTANTNSSGSVSVSANEAEAAVFEKTANGFKAVSTGKYLGYANGKYTYSTTEIAVELVNTGSQANDQGKYAIRSGNNWMYNNNTDGIVHESSQWLDLPRLWGFIEVPRTYTRINDFESDRTNSKVYAVKSRRSPLYFNTEHNELAGYWTAENSALKGDEANPSATAQQFAFLRTDKTPAGMYYMYSVEGNCFIKEKGLKSDSPIACVSFTNVTDKDDANHLGLKIKIGTTGDNVINVTYWNNNSAGGVRYNTNNESDAGNVYELIASYDEVDLSEAMKLINAYENPYTLAVTNAGWATLFLDYNAAIPSGVDAYIVTGLKEDNWLNLVEVENVLPANTGVLVNASEGSYTFSYSTTAATTDCRDNKLEGSVTVTDVEGAAYVLGYAEETNELVFGKAKLTDGSFRNNANKAYLPAGALPANVALSASLRFDFGGTTAIEEVETEAAETVIYDLTGRRVNEITKAGVYIINGKKTLVK